MVSRLVIVCLVFLVGSTGRASAQSPLDRPIRDDASNGPLIVRSVDAQTVARLAAAAKVPMGFVGWDAMSKTQLPAIVASGRPLRQVLDDMINADPRYRWDDDNGVIIVAVTEGLEDATRVLDAPTDGVILENVDSNDAYEVMVRLVGAQFTRSAIGETTPFSVSVPPTRTVRDVLNAIVQSHGRLAWSLTSSSSPLPLIVTLFSGGAGAGVGIPWDTVRSGRSPVHGTIEIRREGRKEDVLDRTIARDGLVPRWEPCICGQFVQQLARATGLPMGLELVPGGPRPLRVQETDLTGLRLRDVLDAVTAAQPEYEWREVGGIIVFRPRGAWENADDPLFRLVSGVQLHDEPTQKVIGAVLSRFGVPHADKNYFPDTRKITLDQGQGAALDLLNALVTAHGQLMWTWEDLPPRDRTAKGLRYRLTLLVLGGGGGGWAVP